MNEQFIADTVGKLPDWFLMILISVIVLAVIIIVMIIVVFIMRKDIKIGDKLVIKTHDRRKTDSPLKKNDRRKSTTKKK